MRLPFKCAKRCTHSQLKVLPWVNKCSLTQPLCGRLLVRDFRAIFFFFHFVLRVYAYCWCLFCSIMCVQQLQKAKSYCKKQQRRRTTHTFQRKSWHWTFFCLDGFSCPCIGISMFAVWETRVRFSNHFHRLGYAHFEFKLKDFVIMLNCVLQRTKIVIRWHEYSRLKIHSNQHGGRTDKVYCTTFRRLYILGGRKRRQNRQSAEQSLTIAYNTHTLTRLSKSIIE